MRSTSRGGSWSSVVRDSRAISSRHIHLGSRRIGRIIWVDPVRHSEKKKLSRRWGGRTGFQDNTVDKPVTRLSNGLVRADNVGVGHDEGIVPGEGHAGVRGDDRELWRRGHLCETNRSVSPPVNDIQVKRR